MRFLMIFLAILLPSAALAQGNSPVALSSEVFVERVTAAADGSQTVNLVAPGVVTPGDRLVFKLSYRNTGATAASDFVVTNPIPESVSFAGTDSAGSVLSVDGGRTWGQLATLRVRGADGNQRPAALGDVTHVRWTLAQAIPAGGTGELTFRGIVK